MSLFNDLGSCGGHFKVILNHLGFGHLGCFGLPWGHLGITWGHLGAPWVSSGPFGRNYGVIWVSFGGLCFAISDSFLG